MEQMIENVRKKLNWENLPKQFKERKYYGIYKSILKTLSENTLKINYLQKIIVTVK